MQTSISQVQPKAIKGMAVLAPKRCRPLQLRSLPQILRLTIVAGAATTDVVLTVTDVKTGFVYTALTVTGNANEATLGAAIRAAWAANPKLNQLFSLTAVQESSGSDLIIDFTARNPNIEYSIAVTGGTGASSFAETQAEGGSGLEFGQLVVRGSNDDEFAVLSASSTVRDIVGALIRTDGNHFQDIPIGAADLCPRGVHMPIAEDVEFWVRPIGAVTPASRVYVCVEAATGRVVGDWGDDPLGTAQVATFTPAANMLSYAVKSTVIVNGREIPLNFEYAPTDGTTITDDAVDGLEDAAAAAITAAGLGSFVTASAASGATTFTLTLAAGVTWGVAPYFSSWNLDTEVVAGTVDTGTADVDMLDVSSICRYTSSGAAGELVKVKLQLQP